MRKGNPLLKPLALALTVFELNFTDLLEMFRFHNSKQGLDIWGIDTDHIYQSFLRDVSAQIMNFSASATLVVDQSRAFGRRLNNESFNKVIDAERVKRFTTNHNILIVHAVRNYTVHRFTPPLTSKHDFNLSYEEGFARFTIRRDSILRHVKLSKPNDSATISLLESLTDDVEFESYVQGYHDDVASYYEWFIDTLKRYE